MEQPGTLVGTLNRPRNVAVVSRPIGNERVACEARDLPGGLVDRADVAAKGLVQGPAELLDAVGALAAEGLRERGVARNVDEEHRTAKRRTGRGPFVVVRAPEALEERPCNETLETFHRKPTVDTSS